VGLRFRPTDKWAIEVYGDYEDRVDSPDRQTYHAFVGYKTSTLRAGGQYIRQIRNTIGEDLELSIASAFLEWSMSEKTWLFARVDRNFDANPEGDRIAYIPFDPTAANTFVVAGIDFWVRENVGFSPNVEVVVYDDPEIASLPKPETDVTPRFTFHFTF